MSGKACENREGREREREGEREREEGGLCVVQHMRSRPRYLALHTPAGVCCCLPRGDVGHADLEQLERAY